VRVYLAAAFERKEEIKAYAKELSELKDGGWEITSTWLTDEVMQTAEHMKAHPDEGVRYAQRDLHDIMTARRIIVFTGPLGRGGHQVEMGSALAWGLEVIVVGPVVNLFCLLAHLQYDTWEGFKRGYFGIEEETDSDE
jgi:hypothetical protein